MAWSQKVSLFYNLHHGLNYKAVQINVHVATQEQQLTQHNRACDCSVVSFEMCTHCGA